MYSWGVSDINLWTLWVVFHFRILIYLNSQWLSYLSFLYYWWMCHKSDPGQALKPWLHPLGPYTLWLSLSKRSPKGCLFLLVLPLTSTHSNPLSATQGGTAHFQNHSPKSDLMVSCLKNMSFFTVWIMINCIYLVGLILIIINYQIGLSCLQMKSIGILKIIKSVFSWKNFPTLIVLATTYLLSSI